MLPEPENFNSRQSMRRECVFVAPVYGADVKVLPLQSVPASTPLYLSKVSAGFPCIVDDFIDCELNLNTRLIKHPHATFFMRAQGNAMVKAGIHSGDILIVDRSIEASHNNIVVAMMQGELILKRLYRANPPNEVIRETGRVVLFEILKFFYIRVITSFLFY